MFSGWFKQVEGEKQHHLSLGLPQTRLFYCLVASESQNMLAHRRYQFLSGFKAYTFHIIYKHNYIQTYGMIRVDFSYKGHPNV